MSRAGRVIVAGAAPGALAGALLAGLLFFLEPDLPFSLLVVGRTVCVYAAGLAAVSILLHLPWLWRHGGRPLRSLPWVVSAVLAGFASIDWSHASYFAYYLPPGINERLFKAGFWLLGGAVGCFYTALLHSAQQKRYGWRSRVLLVLLVSGPTLAQFERREAFRAPAAGSARPSVVAVEYHPRLCVIGLESATLDAVLPLAEQGQLPFLRTMLETGAAARLETLVPTRQSPLWTVVATGKYPYRHGLVSSQIHTLPILGAGLELRILPRWLGFDWWGTVGGGARRVDGEDRRSLAVWEILARLGVATGVVGWPATSPAEGEAKFMVSDRFFSLGASSVAESVWPRDLGDRARLFREPTGESYWSLPGGSSEVVAASVRADEWRATLALHLLREQPSLEAMVVVLPGLAGVSRQYFGGFSEVQFEGGAGSRGAMLEAAGLIASYYQGLDRFLADVWGSGRFDLMAVVSASGVEGSRGWRRLWSQLSREEQLRGRSEQGPDGLMLFRGEGVSGGALVPSAGIEDVLPTLLYAAGFPVARDLDGEVLGEAFEPLFLAKHPIQFLASYEELSEVSGEAARIGLDEDYRR